MVVVATPRKARISRADTGTPIKTEDESADAKKHSYNLRSREPASDSISAPTTPKHSTKPLSRAAVSSATPKRTRTPSAKAAAMMAAMAITSTRKRSPSKPRSRAKSSPVKRKTPKRAPSSAAAVATVAKKDLSSPSPAPLPEDLKYARQLIRLKRGLLRQPPVQGSPAHSQTNRPIVSRPIQAPGVVTSRLPGPGNTLGLELRPSTSAPTGSNLPGAHPRYEQLEVSTITSHVPVGNSTVAGQYQQNVYNVAGSSAAFPILPDGRVPYYTWSRYYPDYGVPLPPPTPIPRVPMIEKPLTPPKPISEDLTPKQRPSPALSHHALSLQQSLYLYTGCTTPSEATISECDPEDPSYEMRQITKADVKRHRKDMAWFAGNMGHWGSTTPRRDDSPEPEAGPSTGPGSYGDDVTPYTGI